MGNIDLRDPNVQIAGMVILVALTVGHIFFLTGVLPFGYKPRAAEISSLEQEYEQLSADLMKAKQTASRLPQVQAEYEELSAQWEEAKSLLPTEKEMAEVLSQVTVAGQRAGVEFLLFEPKPPAPRDIYMENPIALKVLGGYHEVGLFLSRLSNLPRIINVNSVDLRNVPHPVDTSLPDVVEASMDIAAYTLLAEGDRTRIQTAPPGDPAVAKGGQRAHR